jgi:hypothetical protein
MITPESPIIYLGKPYLLSWNKCSAITKSPCNPFGDTQGHHILTNFTVTMQGSHNLGSLET